MIYIAALGVVGILIFFLRDSAKRQGRAEALNQRNASIASINRAIRQVDDAIDRLSDHDLIAELQRARRDAARVPLGREDRDE